VLSTHRRLIAVLGTTAAVVTGLTVTSGFHGGAASTPSASDLCVIAPPVWVHNQQVYPGGLYCVPVPDPSHLTL
jgi:hypothetical protein